MTPPTGPGGGYPPTSGTPGAAAAPPAELPEGHHACVSCSFVNPPGFAFCGRCGAKIDNAAIPQPVEDVGSARTVFAEQAPEELKRLRDQGIELGVGTADPPPAVHADGPPPPPPAGGTAPPVPPVMQTPSVSRPGPPPSQASTVAPTSPSDKPNPGGPAAKLVMLGPDGSPIGERVLAAGERLNIGRAEGPPWDEDAYLDAAHGSLTPTEDGIIADDAGSLNGIYVKLSGRVEVHHGDQFRVGQELLLYEDLPEPMATDDGTERMGSPNPGYWGRLSLLVDPDVASEAYVIKDEGIMIGREQGEITFPTDGYVSGSHCRVVGDDSGVFVEDLGSSNGTYMRVRAGAVLPYGSLVLIGQKLFQLERA